MRGAEQFEDGRELIPASPKICNNKKLLSPNIFETKAFEENITEQKEIYKIFEEKYRRKMEHIDKIQTNVIFCKDPLSYAGTAMDN